MECGLDGFVIGNVKLDGTDGARGALGDFGLYLFDGGFGFLNVSSGEDKFVGNWGLVEGFDGFVANSSVGTCDENNFGCHNEFDKVGYSVDGGVRY